MYSGDLGVVDGGIASPATSQPLGAHSLASTPHQSNTSSTVTALSSDAPRADLIAIAPVEQWAAPFLDASLPVAPRDKWHRRYVAQLVVIDAVAAAFSVVTAFLLRFVLPSFGGAYGTTFAWYLLFAALLPVAWITVVAMNRGYQSRIVGVGPAEFQRIFRAFFHLTALVAFVAYASEAELARGVILASLPLTLAFDVIGRYAARKQLHHQRALGRSMTSVVAVGGATSVAKFTALLQRDRHAGMRVIGACVPSEMAMDEDSIRILDEVGVPLLGDVDSVLESARFSGAHTVAVLSGEISADKLRWISWQLEGTDTELVVSPGLTEVAGTRLHIQPVAGLPMLHVEEPEFTGFRRLLKGAFDRAAAALAIVALSPIFIGVAIAVRIGSRGPVLFRQARVGRDGRVFTMIKFRSMYSDAESRLADLQHHNVNADGLLFKIKNDPRITKVGRRLRKYSLDELPQLFNVLKGDMSLVGPRPPLPAEVARYATDVRRRLLVKPGITGMWQISGRNDLAWDETVRLDLRYVENWSFALDLMILWKTIGAVTSGSGAY
jgi:exopolysaccharide biosynthesis polyprenyl glycosylphosphotransferase